MQILKQIWTDDVVEFKGHFYNIPASKIGPKPVQEPHIPLYLGGYSQGTFARIANYANGWICVIRDSLDQVKSNIDKIRKECYKANRDPENIDIAAILYPNVKHSGYTDKEIDERSRERRLLSGSVDEIGMDLQEIKSIGVNHAILNYNRSSISNSIDDIIDVSKRISAFIR
jgi:alkanesulfonate monooxygenase SsuD/methylene tetrahydromethanopterin reductase-like flavin-dependent oxidoreductase (luciferase family)